MEDVWWAEKFHWTPEQVDSISAERAQLMQFVAQAMDEGRGRNSNVPSRFP